MLEYIKVFGFIILVMVLVELMDFPEWLGKKLRGETSNSNKEFKDMNKKINELEEKINRLEDYINTEINNLKK